MSTEPAIVVQDLTKTYRLGRSLADVPIPSLLPWSRETKRRKIRPEDLVDEEDDLDELSEHERAELEEVEREASRDDGGDKLVEALREVSLEVTPGARLAVLGPVGSGKSTLLKVIGRVTPPTSGRLLVRGRVAPPIEMAASFMNGNATGRQNALRIARLYGVSRNVVRRNLETIFELAGVEDKMDARTRTYSSGQYRRLGISIALNLEPDILLADDRFLGSDPDFVARVNEFLAKTREKRPMTLIFAASSADAVREICDEAIWLEDGAIVDRGPLPEPDSNAADQNGDGGPMKPYPGDGVSPEQRELLALLVENQTGYADAAEKLGKTVETVRDEARSALVALAPDGDRLPAAVRNTISDYLLGATSLDEERLERLIQTPEARFWPRQVRRRLARIDLDGVPSLPVAPSKLTYRGFIPSPHPAAAALTEYLALAIGPEKAREALIAATDKAIWKGRREVKWSDVGQAAGLSHEESRVISKRLVALRREAGRPTAPISLIDHLAVVSACIHEAGSPPADLARLDRDLIVETIVESDRPARALRVRLTLEHRRWKAVLEQPGQFDAPDPGRYRVKARIPAGSLVAGDWVGQVGVEAWEGDTKTEVEHRRAITFEVVDSGDEPPPGASEERPADPQELALDAEWDVSRVEDGG